MDSDFFSKGITLTFKDVDVISNVGSILHQINLTIPRQTMTGIIGASGNGKTSRIRCMTRLLPMTGGSITVNGITIQAIPISSLHALFSVASQERGLFSDTLLANLT